MCLEFGPSFWLWWCCYCSLLSTSKPHCNEVVPKICEEVCSIGGFRVSKEIAQHASQQGKHGNTSRDIVLNHPVLSPDPLGLQQSWSQCSLPQSDKMRDSLEIDIQIFPKKICLPCLFVLSLAWRRRTPTALTCCLPQRSYRRGSLASNTGGSIGPWIPRKVWANSPSVVCDTTFHRRGNAGSKLLPCCLTLINS